jgi:DNA-binding NarL/FixJ family response regulator
MNSRTVQLPLKVFLVEDSSLIRQRLRQLLGSLDGVSIIGEADQSDIALGEIGSLQADVAVVDLHLAQGSGLKLLKGLAQHEPQVVPIVLTNHASSEFKRECLAAGARYFFDKTNEFDLVRQTIRQIVELSSQTEFDL